MSGIEVPEYQAQDLMTTDVLTAYEGWSIERLATFFMTHGITGAPVISSDHKLVGTVSMSDIVRFENADEDVKRKALSEYFRLYTDHDLSREDLDRWSHDAQRSCTVHQIMTREVISVEESVAVDQVVSTLVDCDIHRVFVTESGTITGVITALDVLRKIKGVNLH